jgi:hypothetical protein
VRVWLLVALAVAATLAVAACGGQSKQDKAKNTVCSARSDIQKQVNELKALTPATVTIDGVKKNLTAIQDDLKKIADAQGDLNDARKKQVQDATSQFTSALSSIVSDVGQSLSLSDASTKLQAAAQQLATAYQSSLAKVNCS